MTTLVKQINPKNFPTLTVQDFLRGPISGGYWITPEVASYILINYNTRNRPWKQGYRDRYAADMKAGNWIFNGESVSFSPTLDMLNGQHRFGGCVDSNTPFATFLVFGVNPEAFDSFDSGATRTAADVLVCAGIFSGDNAKQRASIAAATANNLEAYASGNLANAGRRNKRSNRDIEELFRSFPALRASTDYCTRKRFDTNTGITLGCFATMHYFGAHEAKQPDKTEDFFLRIKQLQFRGDKDPAKALYRRVQLMRKHGQSTRGRDALILCLMSLRADLDGKGLVLAQLTWHDGDPLPQF